MINKHEAATIGIRSDLPIKVVLADGQVIKVAAINALDLIKTGQATEVLQEEPRKLDPRLRPQYDNKPAEVEVKTENTKPVAPKKRKRKKSNQVDNTPTA